MTLGFRSISQSRENQRQVLIS